LERNRFILSYWLKDTLEFLGRIWIEPKDWNLGVFEIGWFVVKQQQGKGFALEAAKTSIDMIFINLHAYKVVASVRDHGKYKERNINIIKQLDFQQEGYFREAVQVFTSKGAGPIVGEYHFGLLNKEYVR
jgi:RimJ/RimL family protein N-acetyltransferase